MRSIFFVFFNESLVHANLVTDGNLLAYYQIIISTSHSGLVIFRPYVFGMLGVCFAPLWGLVVSPEVVWFGKVEMGRFRVSPTSSKHCSGGSEILYSVL